MTELHPLTAEMLEASASGFAAAAEAALRRRAPGLEAASDVDAPASWRPHFHQRILELAAAIRMQEPALFERRVAWLRRALRARGADDDAPLRTALLALRDAMHDELPEHLARFAFEPLDEGLAHLDQPLQPDASPLNPKEPSARLTLAYLEACLSAEPSRATAMILEAQGTYTPQQIYTEILAPAQQEIGRLWHEDLVTVAEERLVSETTRHIMALLSQQFAPLPTEGRTVLAASVAGNLHDIGLRMACDLFRLAGWRAIFLGANVPGAQLARAAELFEVDLLILSAALSTHLAEAARAIQAVKQARPAIKVLVGGLVFDEAPAAWRGVGADGYAPSLGDGVATGIALMESAA